MVFCASVRESERIDSAIESNQGPALGLRSKWNPTGSRPAWLGLLAEELFRVLAFAHATVLLHVHCCAGFRLRISSVDLRCKVVGGLAGRRF